MKPHDIDHFFKQLSQHFVFPSTVILTGGGAAILEGVSRGTRDLDFQIVLKNATASRKSMFQAAIEEVEKRTGIAAQYDASIAMWSSIAWPAPRLKSYRYKRFGKIEVRILDPLWWSIGKIARYLTSDQSDVVTVFKKMKVQPEQAMRAWGRALGRSPMSNVQVIFRRQVFYFIEQHSRAVWGRNIDPVKLKGIFLTAARKV
jgi:hypothetical protein